MSEREIQIKQIKTAIVNIHGATCIFDAFMSTFIKTRTDRNTDTVYDIVCLLTLFFMIWSGTLYQDVPIYVFAHVAKHTLRLRLSDGSVVCSLSERTNNGSISGVISVIENLAISVLFFKSFHIRRNLFLVTDVVVDTTFSTNSLSNKYLICAVLSQNQ